MAMNANAKTTSAFTLLELLVAITIGMVVMGLSVSAYHHTQRTIARTEALLRLHRVAGSIGEQWELDATALLQHVACNITTTNSGGATTMTRFTGMRGVIHGFENRLYDFPRESDLAWFRWEWQAASGRITRAESPPAHWVPWYPTGEFSYIEADNVLARPVFGMWPNPVRTYDEFENGEKVWTDPFPVPMVRNTRIFDRLFLTGVDRDGSTTYAGFAAEMDANAVGATVNPFLTNMPRATWETLPVPDPRRTMAEDVTACSITVITRDWTEYQATNRSFDGQTQDGGGDRASRPAVLRLNFTLIDRATGLNQTFTISAKAP